jgi:MFS family permease
LTASSTTLFFKEIGRFFLPKTRPFSSSRLILITNFTEFIDFYLYSHFGFLIEKIFFGKNFIINIETFQWINIFLIAPLMAVISAYVGDIFGRRFVIVNSALIMALASLGVMLLPVEIWPSASAYLLLALRIIQGLAMSAEPMACYLYMMEEKKNRRDVAFYNCVVSVTEGIGAIIALTGGACILYFWGESYWRWIFILSMCSVGMAWVVRRKLAESSEYLNQLRDAKIRFDEHSKIREYFHLQTKEKSTLIRNRIAGFLSFLAYPTKLVFCFFYLTPWICTQQGWGMSEIMLWNIALTFAEHALGLSLFWLVCYKTHLSLMTIGRILYSSGLIIFTYLLWHLETLPLWALFLTQLSIMGLPNFSWISGDIFKSFSVIGRFTNMAGMWAIARLCNFPICVIAMKYFSENFGMSWTGLHLVLPVCAISFLAFFIVKPYYDVWPQSPENHSIRGSL